MRPERLYLQDLIDAADNIAFHISGRSREQFLGDRTVRAAVLHELTVIGEAAARLTAVRLFVSPGCPQVCALWTRGQASWALLGRAA